MSTHLHLVLYRDSDSASRETAKLLSGYTRRFNNRHGLNGSLLRGPVEALRVDGRENIGRVLRYVHENPLKTRVPLVDRAIDYEWSSCRDIAGFRLAGWVDPRRIWDLLGSKAQWTLGSVPTLIDPVTLSHRMDHPSMLGAAVAAVFGVSIEHIRGKARSESMRIARRTFLEVGRMQGYSLAELGRELMRGRAWASQSATQVVNVQAVRVVWTLLSDPLFRKTLDPSSLMSQQSEHNVQVGGT